VAEVSRDDTSHDVVEKIALFFYFSFLDEIRAREAGRVVLKKLRQKSLGKNLSADEKSELIVSLCDQHLEVFSRNARPTGLSFSAGQIILPPQSNWGPWFELRRLSEKNEFYAVLWTRVLGVSEEITARALGVSIGTIRHRVGRGLKSLGRICQSGGFDA
jgi:hypothetical protein